MDPSPEGIKFSVWCRKTTREAGGRGVRYGGVEGGTNSDTSLRGELLAERAVVLTLHVCGLALHERLHNRHYQMLGFALLFASVSTPPANVKPTCRCEKA